MRIETKFTPGQKVWAIYNNKVQEFMVGIYNRLLLNIL